jgi:hypothetical protein
MNTQLPRYDPDPHPLNPLEDPQEVRERLAVVKVASRTRGEVRLWEHGKIVAGLEWEC